MHLYLRQVQRQILTLLTLCSTLAACGNETQPDGFCLFDSECNEGLCDPTSRRCVRSTDQGFLTDAELERRLDMMVADMMIVDASIADLAVLDAQVSAPTQPDQSLTLVDAEYLIDANPASDLDSGTQASSDGDIDASVDTQSSPDAAVSDAEVETDAGNDSGSMDAAIADPN